MSKKLKIKQQQTSLYRIRDNNNCLFFKCIVFCYCYGHHRSPYAARLTKTKGETLIPKGETLIPKGETLIPRKVRL